MQNVFHCPKLFYMSINTTEMGNNNPNIIMKVYEWMISCVVTWCQHHRWSLLEASQQGSSSAVHRSCGVSRVSLVRTRLWPLAAWGEQPYYLRQREVDIRKQQTPVNVYSLNGIFVFYIPKSIHIQSSASFPSVFTFGSPSFFRNLY